MDYMALFTHIQKGKPGSLYLLHGPEEFTKGEALNQMIEQWIPQQVRDLNYQVIDGTETTADTIIAACETLPFLSDRRMVVVKDYTGLTGQRSEDEDILKKYLANVSSSTSLVFYVRGNAEKKRMIYKAIAKYGEAVEFVRLKHPDLIKWARKRFKNYNKKISNPDLEHFILQVGNNLEDMKNEIEKLAAYAGNSSEVTRADIDKLVAPSPEFTVFQFIDAVSVRQKSAALQQMNALLEQGQSIFGILSLIARQFKIMLLCKGYDEMGYTLNQIKDKLAAKPYALHPYSIQKGMQQSRSFTMEQLRHGLNQCVELDYGIKSGKIKDRLGMELLVIKMCSEQIS
ncbi:MAG TPA: DNA polymerase III subunit delta [Clostridiales bacterium]|jgi:DNA polymerase-3 subunit delta|nr:DNA polymerase III subunit delta [Clostridiales bacterium]